MTVFARALREELARFGPTLYLGAQELSTLGVMHDVARLAEGHPQWLRFSSWMEEEGPRHAYVVIETDSTLTPWTRRAIRLADHIVLVADATATEPGPIEVGLLAAHDHDRVRARHSLVLVHPQGTRLPSETQAWLSRRQPGGCTNGHARCHCQRRHRLSIPTAFREERDLRDVSP